MMGCGEKKVRKREAKKIGKERQARTCLCVWRARCQSASVEQSTEQCTVARSLVHDLSLPSSFRSFPLLLSFRFSFSIRKSERGKEEREER